MRGIMLKRLLPAILVLAGLSQAVCAAVETAQWERLAPVTVAKAPTEARGLAEAELSPDVLDASEPSLSDVRITDEEGKEVPYVLERTSHGGVTTTFQAATLINRTFLPRRSSRVTADFSRKFLKEIVRVKTAGVNFRREVLVESSDDGRSWQRVREGALLFRVAGPSGRVDFEKAAVSIPANDHRYLRVTVFNGPDDTQPVAIESVHAETAPSGKVRPALTAPVEIRRAVVSQEKKLTLIEFDLGFRHLPLDRLELTFTDRNFFRQAVLEGRDRETRVIRIPHEDGAMGEKTVPVPWERITSAILFRYTAGGGRDSETSLSLNGAGYRYLRLTINNEDNPPLAFREARLTRFLWLVRFPYEGAGKWRLYFGNPTASAPRYDLPHYADRLAKEGIVRASLGPAEMNPLFSPASRALPWSERHPVILWAALIVVGAVLGALVIRQVRSMRGRESGPGTQQQSR